ncbi:hypothetical protein Q9233_011123 [Columba guinea]|nr:hypothetical protein Q9233_011123 [Columba guinea]
MKLVLVKGLEQEHQRQHLRRIVLYFVHSMDGMLRHTTQKFITVVVDTKVQVSKDIVKKMGLPDIPIQLQFSIECSIKTESAKGFLTHMKVKQQDAKNSFSTDEANGSLSIATGVAQDMIMLKVLHSYDYPSLQYLDYSKEQDISV